MKIALVELLRKAQYTLPHKLKGSEKQGVRVMACNYDNDYYGDRVCRKQ